LGRVLLEDKGKKNTHNDKNSNLRELDTASLGVTFPVDMVFTWVDADDPDFIELFNQYAPVESQKSTLSNVARFKSLDELKYALRSIF
ncbi:TPA: Stealth CR1 domain-containing protein, partial [Citrobacter freundii]